MIKVASFLRRPMTEIEEKTLVKALREEVVIVPCQYKIVQGRGRENDIIEAIPMDCDVAVVKTNSFVTRWISELTNLVVINHKSQYNENHQKAFTGWRVFKNGSLVEFVSAVV